MVSAGVLLSFFLPFALMIEVYALYGRSMSPLAVLLGCVALLHAFLPSLLAMTLRAEDVECFGVFGYLGRMGDPHSIPGGPLTVAVIAFNLTLSTVLAAFVLRGWQGIVRVRGELQRD